jgi:transposase
VSTTTATRTNEYTPTESVLLLAFELGLETWKVGLVGGGSQPPRLREITGGDTRALLREVARAKRELGLPAHTPVVSCYEAGRDGFWLHRFLTHHGIRNHVVDSASIEVDRRARRAKSDRIDLRALLRLLRRFVSGERDVWSVVRVPTVADEDARSLHRELRTLVKERTRSTNRIRGLLMNHGLRLGRLGKDFRGWLERVRQWDGSPLPAGVRRRLAHEYARRALVEQQIHELEAQRRRALREEQGPALDQMRQLLQLRGIGEGSAWLYVREFFAWRRFRNRRQVAALAGLAPTPYQSGDENRDQGISKAGNRHVRSLAVEIAWGWLRYQPDSALSQWYQRRFAPAGPRARKVGIVALARKLLVALWRYLETGVIPDGAVLKT